MPEYTYTWRGKGIADDVTSLEELIEVLRFRADKLEDMRREGVVLAPPGVQDDYGTLYTDDPEVARRRGFEIQLEEWEEQ